MLLFWVVQASLVAVNVANVHFSDPNIVFEWKPSAQSSANADSQSIEEITCSFPSKDNETVELTNKLTEFASPIASDKNDDRQVSMEIHLLVKRKEINTTTAINPDFANCIVNVEFDTNRTLLGKNLPYTSGSNTTIKKKHYDSGEFNVGLHLIINMSKFEQQILFKNGQKILQTKKFIHKSMRNTNDIKFTNGTLVFCPIHCNSNNNNLSAVMITYIAVYNETIDDNYAKFLYNNFRSNMKQNVVTYNRRKLLNHSYVFCQQQKKSNIFYQCFFCPSIFLF